MTQIPTVVTAAGLQPTPPATLLAALLANVAATNPGYTANLPGSLVEDISSTDVGALALIDAAKVELVNSLTPFGANEFLLVQLGNIYGVPQGQATNTSVPVVFSGSVGFTVSQGFVVSDGTYQYVTQAPAIIGAGGSSLPVLAIAVLSGAWAIPSGTVQQLVTSVPTGITLSVNNPTSGTPATGPQDPADYRASVLQAGLAISQGMTTNLKTALARVPGVQPRLVSVQQQSGGFWEVLVGGGDQYQVALAIFESLFDINNLVGSTLNVVSITNANPGVVTTDKNHNYATGQVATITGATGISGINGVPLTITVTGQKTFTTGTNTTSSGAYTGGGTLSPVLRNVTVNINNYPDTYAVRFVSPPQQTVTVSVTWNTIATNFVSAAAVSQLGAPALVDYVNSIAVGQPINLFELQSVFQQSIESVIPAQLLTRMVFAVSINGISTPPSAGTGVIAGDPESYFFATSAGVTITQG